MTNPIPSESAEKIAADIVQRYWPNTATRYDADWRHNATTEIAAAIRRDRCRRSRRNEEGAQ